MSELTDYLDSWVSRRPNALVMNDIKEKVAAAEGLAAFQKQLRQQEEEKGRNLRNHVATLEVMLMELQEATKAVYEMLDDEPLDLAIMGEVLYRALHPKAQG